MKKFQFIFWLALFVNSLSAQLSFTLGNITGTDSINCKYDTIRLVAWSSYTNPVSYSWTGPSSFSGPLVKIHLPGTYTVTAYADNMSQIQVKTIGSDLLAPTATVSPLSQSVSCNPASLITVTATTNLSSHFTHQVISPFGGTVISNFSVANFTPSAAGVYTYCIVNETNGCKTKSTFSISGGQGLPTGTVLSPRNFSIGCASFSFVTVSFTNFVSSSTLR